MNRKKSANEDLGFGTKLGRHRERLINKDGSFNVRRIGGGLGAVHPYQVLITLPWWQFWLAITGSYLLLNACFALLYVQLGVEQLSGWEAQPDRSWGHQFAYAFFFSVQTFTTVGYGAISPEGLPANLLASLESMIGLLGFAVATGVVFGRFSRPSAKLAFSPRMVVSPYRKVNALMFRMGNRRKNQLINLEVQVTAVMQDERRGKVKQRFERLKLERERVTLFPLSWTVVHPINQDSPLHGLDAADLDRMRTEILVVVQGYDDTFAQEVHVQTSYRWDEILWGARFVPAFHTNDAGIIVLEVDKL
ncbi:MAG: ion channel, partial [Bacteroidota bacterium]